MTLDQLFRLGAKIKELTKHQDLVVIGSNAVLGLAEHSVIPPEMAMSTDIDGYLKNDPERTSDLIKALGEDSAFHQDVGVFLDPVRPSLPTLPDGWEHRMLLVERDGFRAWFIDPDDAAIAKYARGEERDTRWIRAGLKAGLVSMAKVQARVGKTTFLDDNEETEARARIAADLKWIAEINSAERLPSDGNDAEIKSL